MKKMSKNSEKYLKSRKNRVYNKMETVVCYT